MINVLSDPFPRSIAVEKNYLESRPSLISSENIDNATLKVDSKSVLFEVDDLFRDHQRKIDNETINKRCDRYGLKLYRGNPRRLFFGSMVADENWEVFQMHAIEAYDVYHIAVFVESNTTHTTTPRNLRFQNSEERDLILTSKIFGPKTNVFIDFWLEDWPELTDMNRESEQRNAIIHRWKKEGMKRDDVAIMADIDEVFSRDFLRALQTCDFPELRPGQNCHRPKICPLTISFEASPFCINSFDWFHPDVISGQCVEGIGDPTERVVPLRNHQRMYGERHESFGRFSLDAYPDYVHKSGQYPLFNGPDIRTVVGDRGMPYTWKHNDGHGTFAAYGVAYHFHNWFSDLSALRQKYLTYAHGDASIMEKTLSQGGEDLDLFVRCVRDIGNEANPNSWKRDYYEKGWEIKGPRPIFFQNKTYVKMRHALVQKMVHEDEAVYGSSYDEDNKWVENTLRSKVSSNQWKSITKDSKSKPTILKPPNGKSHLIKVPQVANDMSVSATIMGMALGLSEDDLKRFVGSLRATGYKGHIILGVKSNVDKNILNYMKRNRVTPKKLIFSNCTFEPFYTNETFMAEKDMRNKIGLTVCIKEYPNIKQRWAKYALGRDWLQECNTCTGPVMITDVRDVYFQSNPFALEQAEVSGLQVFEEHPAVTTEHWLVDWPVGDCKGIHLKRPMLCSGTTIGTRDAMFNYLNKMYEEMKRWISDPKCRFISLADDQSIHNWLYYNGDLENAVAIKHRQGLVNTVGFEGNKIYENHCKKNREKGLKYPESIPFEGASKDTWISDSFGITNKEGKFTNLDGSISPVIHQYDRLGIPFQSWLETLERSWENDARR